MYLELDERRIIHHMQKTGEGDANLIANHLDIHWRRVSSAFELLSEKDLIDMEDPTAASLNEFGENYNLLLDESTDIEEQLTPEMSIIINLAQSNPGKIFSRDFLCEYLSKSHDELFYIIEKMEDLGYPLDKMLE